MHRILTCCFLSRYELVLAIYNIKIQYYILRGHIICTLLEEESWKKLKWLVNRPKLTEILMKQTKLQSFRISPRYKYGFEVPKNIHKELTKRMAIQSGVIQTHSNLNSSKYMICSKIKVSLQDVRYHEASGWFKYTLYLMSKLMEDTRAVLLQMDTLQQPLRN